MSPTHSLDSTTYSTSSDRSSSPCPPSPTDDPTVSLFPFSCPSTTAYANPFSPTDPNGSLGCYRSVSSLHNSKSEEWTNSFNPFTAPQASLFTDSRYIFA
jgi:hypothetical protein